jgi:hypothetical protein
MLQDFLVRLSLAMLEAIEVGGVRFSLIAGFQMREIALNVT